MRRAVTGRLGLTRTRRRPDAASPGTVAAEPAAPAAPKRPRAPRQPPATAAALPTPVRTGWIARLFRRKAPPAASSASATARPGPDHTPFTAETHPSLSPEARAILNTPAKDLDPAILSLLLSGIARHIAANMPPEAGMDERTVLTQLAARFGMRVRDVSPEELAAQAPQAAQQPDHAESASPDPGRDTQQAAQAQAEQAAPQDSAPEPQGVSPVPPAAAEAPAIRQPTPAGTRATAPDAAFPLKESLVSRPRRIGGRDSSRRIRRRDPATYRFLRRPRSKVPHRHHAPPTRRLTYAACAGPP